MAVTTDVPSNREQQPHLMEVATVEIPMPRLSESASDTHEP